MLEHFIYLACTGLRSPSVPQCVCSVGCLGALRVRGGGQGAALGKYSRGQETGGLSCLQMHIYTHTHPYTVRQWQKR